MEIEKILGHEHPSRFVYAPNYWQWFKHQRDHGIVPEEISHISSLTDLYKFLGVDIFSRNVYCDPEKYWIGGLCMEVYEGYSFEESISWRERDKVIHRKYSGVAGDLDETLTYIFNESTLVQKKFLFSDYYRDLARFRNLVACHRWEFNTEKYREISGIVGDDGIVIAGEFYSPLKMLHFAMGPVNAVYFLMDCPGKAAEILKLHEEAQLRCIEESVSSGVKVVMSMDNLDTMFHPPDYIEQYSSSFYVRASEICHRYGAKFFIHACGQQRDNLRLIASYGVDGLEGVASPPLGDVEIDEAMAESGGNFIITGGISAFETRELTNREMIFVYVEQLFRKMVPYKNRFVFASGCNTAIDTSWETIKNFRDAWIQFRDMK